MWIGPFAIAVALPTNEATVWPPPPNFLIRLSSALAWAFVSLRCSFSRFLYGAFDVIPMSACRATSSSRSLPYASLKYWISFASRWLGSAMSPPVLTGQRAPTRCSTDDASVAARRFALRREGVRQGVRDQLGAGRVTRRG